MLEIIIKNSIKSQSFLYCHRKIKAHNIFVIENGIGVCVISMVNLRMT